MGPAAAGGAGAAGQPDREVDRDPGVLAAGAGAGAVQQDHPRAGDRRAQYPRGSAKNDRPSAVVAPVLGAAGTGTSWVPAAAPSGGSSWSSSWPCSSGSIPRCTTGSGSPSPASTAARSAALRRRPVPPPRPGTARGHGADPEEQVDPRVRRTVRCQQERRPLTGPVPPRPGMHVPIRAEILVRDGAGQVPLPPEVIEIHRPGTRFVAQRSALPDQNRQIKEG